MLIQNKAIKDPDAFDKLLTRHGMQRTPGAFGGKSDVDLLPRHQGQGVSGDQAAREVIAEGIRKGYLWPWAAQS